MPDAPSTNNADASEPGATSTFTVGGTITGLEGDGLLLESGGDSVVVSKSDKTFVFPKRLEAGARFAVTVKVQPSGPAQTCVVTNGEGTVSGNVTSVSVDCSTNTYVTRVKVTGLVGTGLVLQNNGGDDLTVNASGDFAFAKKVSSGAPYLVTIKTQPANEECEVKVASGTVVDADVTATVTCRQNRVVFTTSTVYDGKLGGLDGADAKCQARATAANLPGTFRAWLSDATGSPSTRFNKSTVPYVLIDGTVVADSYAALTTAPLKHALDLTEIGGVVVTEPQFGRQVVWSTTRENGTVYWDEYSCVHWTSNAETDASQVGSPIVTDTGWSASWTGQPCSRSAPLYCFEQ
ncbi:surface antigen protein [Labilithrix luteola]|uniref:Surface antigen protein n=1 Tax=Labilithrix luteola TaxID=1391654 RepID=A0A0K1QA78_9BACT|nr:surface antigen protein [Labilithrix luteola]